MRPALHALALACAGLASFNVPAFANARLVSVTSLTGCVAGPTGKSVQTWDVEPGGTYQLTLADVTECGNGGTAPTILVRVNDTSGAVVERIASRVAARTYSFAYTVPVGSTCSGTVFYCATTGSTNSGLPAHGNGGGAVQARLRAASFGTNCTGPTAIEGDCATELANSRTWADVKQIYR